MPVYIVTLLDMIDSYNSDYGEYPTLDDIREYASKFGATLDMDGWYIRGFGDTTGYYPYE